MRFLKAYTALVCLCCFCATLMADRFVLKVSGKWLNASLFVGIGFVVFPTMLLIFVNAMKGLRHHRTVTRYEWNASYRRSIPLRVYLVGVAGVVLMHIVAQPWLIREPLKKGSLSDDGGRTYLTTLHDVIEIPREVYERARIGRFQEISLIGAYFTWCATAYLVVAVKSPIFDDEFRFDDLFDANSRR